MKIIISGDRGNAIVRFAEKLQQKFPATVQVHLWDGCSLRIYFIREVQS